jgi:hypothetical protein
MVVAAAGLVLMTLAGAAAPAPACTRTAFEPCPCINPICRPGCGVN